MASTVLDMSMSLDGVIARTTERPDKGLGSGGLRLHAWAFPDVEGGDNRQRAYHSMSMRRRSKVPRTIRLRPRLRQFLPVHWRQIACADASRQLDIVGQTSGHGAFLRVLVVCSVTKGD